LKTQDPHEIKIELIRAQKWAKMIQNWNKTSAEKLKKRVYKGIPNSLRSQVWAKLLHVDQLTDDQKNKYKVIMCLRIIFVLFSSLVFECHCLAAEHKICIHFMIFLFDLWSILIYNN